MKVALVGSRWFGAQALQILLERGDEVEVVATNGEDALATAAAAAGLPLLVLEKARRVTAEHLRNEVDVIVAAHCHAFIMADARARATRAAIGYHPSLLPRHRGIAAVEWTMASGDAIAGGTIYHLSETLDGGAIAAQDWCFVYPEDDAKSLWRRALAPMGLKLVKQVLSDIDADGRPAAYEQDPRAVTLAPPMKQGGEPSTVSEQATAKSA
jgi:methionyl-tRNA formyltransferase